MERTKFLQGGRDDRDIIIVQFVCLMQFNCSVFPLHISVSSVRPKKTTPWRLSVKYCASCRFLAYRVSL